MFRAKFCAGLLQLHATAKLQFHGQLQPLGQLGAFAQLLRQLGTQRWVVFAKGSVVGPDHVLNYFGRYTHRVAISNRRLRTLDPSARTVAFSYKDYADGHRLKTMVLPAGEFIRRFALHLLPAGFTKIRHYGLLGNNRRKQRVALARAALEKSPLRFEPSKALQPPTSPPPPILCPHCQSTNVRCVARIDCSGKCTLFTRALLLMAAPGFADSS